MFTKFKKSISILLIASLGGFAGAYIYSSHLNHEQIISVKNSALKQNVQFAGFPGTQNESLVDFTKAAEMSVHAVVHVKTTSSNHSANNPFDPFGFWGQPRN